MRESGIEVHRAMGLATVEIKGDGEDGELDAQKQPEAKEQAGREEPAAQKVEKRLRHQEEVVRASRYDTRL